MVKSHLRGHEIEFINNEWVYMDTKVPTISSYEERDCGYCRLPNRSEGHDACLGTLPGVMNACCGHGHPKDAYVQLLDGCSIHGEDGETILNILKKYK